MQACLTRGAASVRQRTSTSYRRHLSSETLATVPPSVLTDAEAGAGVVVSERGR